MAGMLPPGPGRDVRADLQQIGEEGVRDLIHVRVDELHVSLVVPPLAELFEG